MCFGANGSILFLTIALVRVKHTLQAGLAARGCAFFVDGPGAGDPVISKNEGDWAVKAVVYVAITDEGRAYPFWTVSWETDLMFWMHEWFRLAERAPIPHAGAQWLCRLRPMLPLGAAEAVCERLKERMERMGAQRVSPEEASRLLQEAAGPGQGSDSLRKKRGRLARWGFRTRANAADRTDSIAVDALRVADWRRMNGGGCGGGNRDADGNGCGGGNAKAGGDGGESGFSGGYAPGCGNGGVGAGADWHRDEAAKLLRAARQAGRQLEGRSLLLDEALGLLSQADSGDALRQLQLAALLGEARLAAAIEPPRGRRGLRCRRCGSGENRMRRSACASCGSDSCAVCEACITMGRSRACGLLVAGPAQMASLGHPPHDAGDSGSPLFVDRWGLSRPQLRASEAAVRFLREVGDRGGRGRDERRQAKRASAGEQHGLSGRLSRAWGRRLPDRIRRRLSACLLRLVPHANRELGKPPSRRFLLWAVTGAGKTEMMFPLLEEVLSRGGRALVATPRRDVVLELAPRLAKAFPGTKLAVLYGGSEDRWSNAPLTLATTHQLLRFQEAFDLVLIDELDAFPYHNDPMLHYAAMKARRRMGATVFLSATPPHAMQREARSGRLPCARVPVRFHRRPLPVPARLTVPPIAKWVNRGRVPAALRKLAHESVRRGAQLFIFVPYIRHVEPIVALLRRHAGDWGLSREAIGGTSSKDPDRENKVTDFRNRRLRVLVTTTILERGVTIPRSDVCILDAHHAMFDDAALVQMAGRAGRSAEDPKGRVFFCSAYVTRSQKRAKMQIRSMNRLARKLGFLEETPG